RRQTRRGSSTRSSAPGRPPGSASRSARRSSRPTAARSPCRTSRAAAHASLSPWPRVSTAMTSPTVLIVDDDVSVLHVLTAAAEARDFAVTTAAAGRPALEQLRLGEPDVVILDLGLPDIDGVEVCRLMRRTARCPIIVLSADADEDRKVVALDDGADDY